MPYWFVLDVVQGGLLLLFAVIYLAVCIAVAVTLWKSIRKGGWNE